MANYFQCQRCQRVYQDVECQCPESGMELCQHCYKSFGEAAAYQMEKVAVSRWYFVGRDNARKRWWNLYECPLDDAQPVKFYATFNSRRSAEDVMHKKRKLTVKAENTIPGFETAPIPDPIDPSTYPAIHQDGDWSDTYWCLEHPPEPTFRAALWAQHTTCYSHAGNLQRTFAKIDPNDSDRYLRAEEGEPGSFPITSVSFDVCGDDVDGEDARG